MVAGASAIIDDGIVARTGNDRHFTMSGWGGVMRQCLEPDERPYRGRLRLPSPNLHHDCGFLTTATDVYRGFVRIGRLGRWTANEDKVGQCWDGACRACRACISSNKSNLAGIPRSKLKTGGVEWTGQGAGRTSGPLCGPHLLRGVRGDLWAVRQRRGWPESQSGIAGHVRACLRLLSEQR